MSYRDQIRKLTETHRVLDEEVKRLESINADPMRITELKRRKLIFKDELAKLHKLEWEESTQRTGYDDDR